MRKQMGPVVFSFEPTGVAHAAYTALGSLLQSRRGEPPKLPTRPRNAPSLTTAKFKIG